MRPRTVSLCLVLLAVAAMPACTGATGGDGRVAVVASFYPLAWAAEQVGGSRVSVENLTPPGVEAHDATLSAGQRADLETADLVFILGDLGFQPGVEEAARDARGRVVRVTDALDLLPSTEENLTFDPHVWLDPVLMQQIVVAVRDALVAVDPAGADAYERRAQAVGDELAALDTAYRDRFGGCAYTRFVTTHEAFGYLAAEYGLDELGIEGLTPESEPSASRIQAAAEAISSGEAAPVVFFEATDEGRRVGQGVAADIGVPALELGTLEFEPDPGDYVSVMRANLAVLGEGLQCPA